MGRERDSQGRAVGVCTGPRRRRGVRGRGIPLCSTWNQGSRVSPVAQRRAGLPVPVDGPARNREPVRSRAESGLLRGTVPLFPTGAGLRAPIHGLVGPGFAVLTLERIVRAASTDAGSPSAGACGARGLLGVCDRGIPPCSTWNRWSRDTGPRVEALRDGGGHSPGCEYPVISRDSLETGPNPGFRSESLASG